jgi:hypothetical protein
MQAAAIAQTYLDEVAAIVMADDWDSYTNTICRPFLLITHTDTMTFATPHDIRGIYQNFVLLLHTQRVTDFIRLVETADLIDQNLISARYVTHLMAGGNRIMNPVVSSISLRLEGNRWRAASITNAVSNSRWPLLMPKMGTNPL